MKRFLGATWAVFVVALAVGMLRGADGPAATAAGTKIKVACVGDSITAGAGLGKNTYPAQLARLLGDGYEVKNFGLSGATLLNAGDKPYMKAAQYKGALAMVPDVVVIMLGTNDSKPQNWKQHDGFVADYKELIGAFRKANEKVKVYVCLPVPAYPPGAYGIRGEVIEKEELPLVTQAAKEMGASLIDLFTALSGHKELFPDGVHPNGDGAGLMARAVYTGLTGKEAAASQPAGR